MHRRLRLQRLVLTSVLLMTCLAACGGGGGDSSEPPQPQIPIDLSGIWAGTWSGVDPVEGNVYGHWEADLAQNDTDVSGSIFLSGDVDCHDGVLAGSVNPSNQFSGTASRAPCLLNSWELNAVNLDDLSASGTWGQPESGAAGTFSGIQVATAGGPRIRFFTPPGGKAGSLVTIVGERFQDPAAAPLLKFGDIPAAALETPVSNRLVAAVPEGVSNGPIIVQAAAGKATSARAFISDVTSPSKFVSRQIGLGPGQTGIAVNPDGRRIYYAANHSDPALAGLMMLDSTSQEILNTTPLDASANAILQSIAVSPDGRRVYVASDTAGVGVFDAINGLLQTTIPVSSGQGMALNPQGLALSPDGHFLYVADNVDGGAVAILDTDSYGILTEIELGPGFTPQGVAANPDGKSAYFVFSAASDQSGRVLVYDTIGHETVSSIEVGLGPVGLAVTPDGQTLYVSNGGEDTVDVIDLQSLERAWTIPVNAGPAGLAISPDGQYVYIACRFSGLVDILPVATPQVLTSLGVYPDPVHVAFTPDGKRAYVSHASFGYSEEIGGKFTLATVKAGSGIGFVNSSPGTISCGFSCQDSFENGTIVSLSAIPASGSLFANWSGDPDCLDGVVTMDADKYCIATFSAIPTGTTGTQVYGGLEDIEFTPCFIATAAYGSYLDPHVETLRAFRDRVLLSNAAGRMFVDFYYRHSPPVAELISRHAGLRLAARILLTPLVMSIEYPVAALVICIVVLGEVGRRVRRKQRAHAA